MEYNTGGYVCSKCGKPLPDTEPECFCVCDKCFEDLLEKISLEDL